MDTNDLTTVADQTVTSLVECFCDFSEAQVNVVPFEGSWTGGQLVKHVIMSGSGFIKMINGPVNDTERDPYKFAEKIKSDFLDFSTKNKSPDFVIPPDTIYKKEDLVSSIERLKKKLKQAITTLDLTKTCTAFRLPVYGFLTRMEAIYFIIYHTKRHNHQLKNIYDHISAGQGQKM